MISTLFVPTLLLLCVEVAFAQSNIETCNPGSFRDGLACVKCPPGTFSDGFNRLQCSPCPAGRFRTLEGASSEEQCLFCPAGSVAQEPGSSKCTKCPPDTDALPGSRFCGKCNPGAELFRGDAPCISCYRAFFSNDTVNKFCKRCPDGTFTGGGNKPFPFKRFGATECQKCPPGTYRRNSKFDFDPVTVFLRNTCNPCQRGTFSDVEGARSCKLCRPGTFSDSGATSCTLCPRGQFNNRIFGVQCRPCPSGKITVGKGAAACKDPEHGCTFDTFENEDGECMACLPGERLDIVKKKCIPCGKNEVSNGGVDTKCKKCPRDKIPLGDLTRLEKAGCMCKPGFIDDREGGCFPCPAGTFWEYEMSFFLTTEKFKRIEGDDAIIGVCTPCPVGTFSDTPGMTSCKKCAEDNFQDKEGGTSCQPCPRGSRSPRIPEDFEDTNRERCITDESACEPGQVRDTDGKCSAIRCFSENKVLIWNRCVGGCKKNYRLKGKRCTSCSLGVSPGGTSRKCTPCLENQKESEVGDGCVCGTDLRGQRTGLLNGTCTTCPAGTEPRRVGGALGFAAKCVPCREGTAYSGDRFAGDVSDYCIECRRGFFNVGKGAKRCTRCPKGTVRFRDLFGRLSGNCRSRDPYV